MKRLLLTSFCVLLLLTASAQDSIPGMTYQRFYYPSGQIASEGYMRDGKPDGYWKTYHETGNIKAEGNRVGYLLDGIWKFYSEQGALTVSIEYSESLKNGKRMTYLGTETLEENFVDDIKQGWSYTYYPDGKVKNKTNFEQGREQGIAYEYDTDGQVITLVEWRNGFVLSREQINRRDRQGRKQGLWKEFYPDGIVKTEASYVDDVLHGYLKEYNREGNLENVYKYADGQLVIDAVEVTQHELRTDYYPDGTVKIVGTYKNGMPHGVRKEYKPDGSLEVVYIFDNGILTSMGVMDAQGKKQGVWKEYYNTGQVMAEGKYASNIRVGQWTYYYRNGQVEQTGSYTAKGKPDGKWMWYYPSGSLHREEEYVDGMLDGLMTEYDESGSVIAKGKYVEDLEEGPWMTHVNDNKEEGEYVAGAMEGLWKSSYPDGTVYFEGKYIADLPNGKHVWYWENGRKRMEGSYVMGVREGDWKTYDAEGTLVLVVTYRNGVEIRYEGVKIEPEIDDVGVE